MLNELNSGLKTLKETTKRVFNPNANANVDLYVSIANFVLPRLVEYKKQNENKFSYPAKVESHAEWMRIIDKMIFSFENHDDFKYYNALKNLYGDKRNVDNEYIYLVEFESYLQKLDEGFELFGKYFKCLNNK